MRKLLLFLLFAAAVHAQTKFYWRNQAAPASPPAGEQSTAYPDAGADNLSCTPVEDRVLSSAAGAVQTSKGCLNNSDQVHDDGYLLRFSSQALAAQTIGSGNWTVRLAAAESNNNANYYMGIVIYVWRTGTGKVGTISDSNVTLGNEFATSETGRVATFSGSSLDINENDYLVVEVWFHGTPGMSVQYSGTIYYNGATDPTEGTATSDAASHVESPSTINYASGGARRRGIGWY